VNDAFDLIPNHVYSMMQTTVFRTPLAISLGAIAGALSRYWLGLGAAYVWGTAFPYGTLLINLTGCFGMGWFTTLALERLTISPEIRLLVTTGFLGAYTTFSSYELESFTLLGKTSGLVGLGYWIGSPILGMASFYLGVASARIGRG
jgi:CrcB protein